MKNFIEFIDKFGRCLLIPTKNIRDIELASGEMIIRLIVREELPEQSIVACEVADVKNIVNLAKDIVVPNIQDKTLSVSGHIGNHVLVNISDIVLICETSFKRACIVTSGKSKYYNLYVNEYYKDIKKMIELLEV